VKTPINTTRTDIGKLYTLDILCSLASRRISNVECHVLDGSHIKWNGNIRINIREIVSESVHRIILSRVGVLDWMIGTTGNYSAVAILRTFQLTVAHALGFSAFTSRILTTDLSQSHCRFDSHMKFSFHSLIPFLPFRLSSSTAISRTRPNSNSSCVRSSLYSLGTDPAENIVK
jgi:hypothetical protein